MEVLYKLDGVDLRDYGVYISKSEGVLSRPKAKKPFTMEWDEYHGEVVDLATRTYEARDIMLECFIKAANQWEFQDKCNTFLALLDANVRKRLSVMVAGLSGGENIILKTSKWQTLGFFTALGNGITTSVLNYYNTSRSNKFACTLSQKYTLSFNCSALSGPFLAEIWSTTDTENKRHDIVLGANKFTFTGTSGMDLPNCELRFFGIDNTTSLACTVSDIKMETGEVATGYTPAPADLKPLLFEVYLSEGVDIKKTWNEKYMTGTFNLKLREPEPVKKVIKHIRTGEGDKTVSITVTSTKLLNIYWGDRSHTYDVSGTTQTVTHTYTVNGTYYILVTGNIDEITSLTSSGEIVWDKL